MDEQVDQYAKIIWDYMLMHQELRSADAIFAMGTSDVRVAERAAELYHQGYAQLIITSGFPGVRNPFPKPEAEVFADVLIDRGVPKNKILIEPKASNTGENILFTKKLLQQHNISLRSVIVVQKPYMERRTWATMQKQWPEIECRVTSPQVTYENWQPRNKIKPFLDTMVGDLQRLREYPKYGFQTEQNIPDGVWQAGEELVRMGFGGRPPKPPQ